MIHFLELNIFKIKKKLYSILKHQGGTSLADQWLRLCFQCRGRRFDPWSGD